MSRAESDSTSDVSLPAFLSDRARHASDVRLAVDAGAGFVVAVAAALWRGPSWVLACAAGLCFLSYGSWGIADRELRDRGEASGAGRHLLKAARIAAVIVGTAAAIVLALGGLAVAFGTIIS